MPEVAEPQPVKRGPGRPRKVVVPKVASAPTEDAWKTPEPVQAPKPVDPRIGQECDPNTHGIGFDDGATYLCKNGKIVERVN